MSSRGVNQGVKESALGASKGCHFPFWRPTLVTMGTPNTTLRAVRMGLLMSQDDLARALRTAGQRVGEPNDATKRLIQRWESGTTTAPRPVYARALERVTGLPIEALGFPAPMAMATVRSDGHGGHDAEATTTDPAAGIAATAGTPIHGPTAAGGEYSGVWLSEYEYFSSGRARSFTGRHYVVVLQHGSRLTVRSLPGSASSVMSMDLEADRNIVTGTWTEQTAEDSYYQGARYHGAIQMLIEPTGRKMSGQWVGFGKNFDVNTGPWSLTFRDGSTSKHTIELYNRKPG